jgi:PncC family amidohydrolase
MDSRLSSIASALIERNQTLATAESCTGGLVGGALTRLPGSSAWYRGGIVAYSNSLKACLLDVPPGILASHGAVSPETARAMAEGARRTCKADWAVSLTGIAGPDGGTPEKPVGLVFMAVAGPGQTQLFEHRFSGNRHHVRAAAVTAILEHLLDTIGSAPR